MNRTFSSRTLTLALAMMIAGTAFSQTGPGPGPGPAPAPVSQGAMNAVSVDWAICLVHVIKSGPAKATIGQTVLYTLDIKCVHDAADVVISDHLPDGVTYVKSEPEAGVNGNVLSWRYRTLNEGDMTTFKVWVRMDREGEMRNCATVSAVPRGCIVTMVGRPALGIQKTGPATAGIGQEVAYNVVVSNTGNTTVEDVVVTDSVPTGMSHASGETLLTYRIGNLEPGQSRNIPVSLKTLQRGRFTNRVVAESANAGKVASEATTVVTQPALQLTKTGPREQFIGRTAIYSITVSNPGDAPLSNIVITDTVPEGNRILSADGASVEGNRATWRLASLAPDEKQTVQLSLTSPVGGTFNNEAFASAGGLTANAAAPTLWKGYAGLLLEMIDTVDPIEIGQTTDYVITITNQGTAPDTNIRAVLQVPPQMEVVSAGGATPGYADGKTVLFDACPRLDPKQAARWTVRVKAVSAGDSRATVRYTSDLIKTPVAKEESTHTY